MAPKDTKNWGNQAQAYAGVALKLWMDHETKEKHGYLAHSERKTDGAGECNLYFGKRIGKGWQVVYLFNVMWKLKISEICYLYNDNDT